LVEIGTRQTLQGRWTPLPDFGRWMPHSIVIGAMDEIVSSAKSVPVSPDQGCLHYLPPQSQKIPAMGDSMGWYLMLSYPG
jgi:hypothetical protein